MIDRIQVDADTRAFSKTTNAYVVGETDSLLVDPGGVANSLAEALTERDVGHVAVTHHHPDHLGALAQYAREFDLTVWARAGRTDSFEAATGVNPDRTFRPGDVIPVAGGVRILDTPGHAPEHVAFEVDDSVLCGDLAVAVGSVVVGSPEGDMRAYLTSLRRLHARNPDRLLPGHGPVIEEARATCERLLSHRLDREKRVLDAVKAGCEAPPDIVEEVYEKDVSDVYDLALATTVAHLEKLDVEDRVRWNGSRARPVRNYTGRRNE